MFFSEKVVDLDILDFFFDIEAFGSTIKNLFRGQKIKSANFYKVNCKPPSDEILVVELAFMF